MIAKTLLPFGMALVLANATTNLGRDELLVRSITVPGKARSVSQLLSLVESSTGRHLFKSRYVPDDPVYVCCTAAPGSILLEEVSELLSDEDYSYGVDRAGDTVQSGYIFQRTPASNRARAIETEKRFFSAINHPDAPGARNRHTAAGLGSEAVAARYDLLRSLPPAVLRPAVQKAINGERAILPLRLFNPTVIRAAHGGVNVTNVNQRNGDRRTTFSSQEVDRGNGFVALECRKRRGDSMGLRVRIGSGQPPGSSMAFAGPSTDIILGLDRDEAVARSSRKPLAIPSGRAPLVRSPADKVTISAKGTLEGGEQPIENVLRQLAARSNLPVLARWDRRSARQRARLTADLVEVPLKDAVSAIGKNYGLNHSLTEDAIRFRPLDTTNKR